MKKSNPVKARYYPGRKRPVSIRMTKEATEYLYVLLYCGVAGDAWFSSAAGHILPSLREACPELVGKDERSIGVERLNGNYTILRTVKR